MCPILPGQQVLDLGCGPGDISAEFSARGISVLGIDQNSDLLNAAKLRCPECRFKKQDLKLLKLTPTSYDGLWCSFTAAYFVDFEMDNLLGHTPLSKSTEHTIAAFYEQALSSGRYHFRIGKKIESALRNRGVTVTSVTLEDPELSSTDRRPKNFFGKRVHTFVEEFIQCIT